MRVVVLGGGESGFGAAYLAKTKGMEVYLSDNGPIREKYRELLEKHEIPFEDQGHSEELVLNADWVVKSPGIPKKADIVYKIQQKGIRLSSEIEFAAEFTQAKIIAITGSNGKTTTTSLIYHLLKQDGLHVGAYCVLRRMKGRVVYGAMGQLISFSRELQMELEK